jgi:transposase
MPRAYSTDLRERALAAYEAGEGSRAGVARRLRVGGRALSGWLRAAREGGRRGAKPRAAAAAAAPVGGAGAALAELVAEQNDATLAEYADRLAERAGVRRSLAAVCRALKRLGLAREKRRAGPPSRGARTSPPNGRRGAPGWPGSTRVAWSSSTRPGSTPG